MELIKSLYDQFAEVMKRQKYTRLFAYYADGTEITGLDVWFIMLGDNSISIQGEDHFMCTVQFSKVKNVEFERMPDETAELRMYLIDGTEIALDTY